MLSYLFQQVCSILLFGLWGELGIWDSFFFTEPGISDFSQMLPLLFSPPTSATLNSLALPMDLNSEFILLQLKAPHNWKKKIKNNSSHWLLWTILHFIAGRRICAGETLAKMELFLFFTSLLQRFTFQPPPGVSSSDLDLSPAISFNVVPKPYKICAVARS